MPSEAEKTPAHPWWCDCAGCWTGITKRAPKPLTLFQRIRAILQGEQP